MALSTTLPTVVASPHLDVLLAEVDDLSRRVADVSAPDRGVLGQRQLVDTAAATLALDGTANDGLPDLDRAREIIATARSSSGNGTSPRAEGSGRAETPRGGTWLDAMGAVEPPTDELIRALELVGAVAGLSADDLAHELTGHASADALRELHRRLTRGLVADDRAGAPRTTDQAVHDTSIGQIIYLPVSPDHIPRELDRLTDWLTTTAPSLHPVVAGGVLHAELLRIHPFDAANGRLARTAAHLLLRAGGRDPDGLAAFEPVLAGDPMGYHQAMADTIRRRDATRWVERWAEVVAAGLRASARTLGAVSAAPPARAARFVADRTARAFTLADYLDVVDRDREVAVADLRALLDAGRIDRVLGTSGLRFVVRH